MKNNVYNIVYENYVDTPDGSAEIIVRSFRDRRDAELDLRKERSRTIRRFYGNGTLKSLRKSSLLVDEDKSYWALLDAKGDLLERATIYMNEIG